MSDSNSRFGISFTLFISFKPLLGIQSTIDRLSLNFDKLENAHYGINLLSSLTSPMFRITKKVSRRQ